MHAAPVYAPTQHARHLADMHAQRAAWYRDCLPDTKAHHEAMAQAFALLVDRASARTAHGPVWPAWPQHR